LVLASGRFPNSAALTTVARSSAELNGVAPQLSSTMASSRSVRTSGTTAARSANVSIGPGSREKAGVFGFA
jgi:hypothetical protein